MASKAKAVSAADFGPLAFLHVLASLLADMEQAGLEVAVVPAMEDKDEGPLGTWLYLPGVIVNEAGQFAMLDNMPAPKAGQEEAAAEKQTA